MKAFATMTKTNFVKNPNTKTTYTQTDKEVEEIDEIKYNKIVEASPFFRSIGGKEYHVKSYTKRGYITVKITSTSPDKEHKTIREFKIH